MGENNLHVDGDALRARRLELGLSQEMLAKAADCTPRTISNLEKGKSAYARTIGKVAAALELDVANVCSANHEPLGLDDRESSSEVERPESARQLPGRRAIILTAVACALLLASGSALVPVGRAIRERQTKRAIDAAYALLREGDAASSGERRRAFLLLHANGQPLTDLDLSGVDLSGLDLAAADLRRSKFYKADLTSANLSRADLTDADLTEATLVNATMVQVNAPRAKFLLADLDGANLTRAVLIMADLNATFRKATLNSSYLFGANMKRGNFTDADLRECDLIRANATGAVFAGANFKGAILTETGLSGANLQRSNWNWTRAVRTDLSGADLTDARIGICWFNGANLRGAKFSRAMVTHSDFGDANLEDTTFESADATMTKFRGANLLKTVLVGTDMTDVDLDGAIVERGDFFERLGELANPPSGNLDAWQVVPRSEPGRKEFVIRSRDALAPNFAQAME